MLKIKEISRTTPVSVYDSFEYGQAVAVEENGEWILIEGAEGEWRLPLIMRPIPGTSHVDAVSPYGYGGLHVAPHLNEEEVQERWKETKNLLAARGIVSIFLRFPPFLPYQVKSLKGVDGLVIREAAKTVLVPITTVDEMWKDMHRRSRTAVRAAQKAGCKAEVVKVNAKTVAETREIYEQTMSRVGAAAHYFFSDSYYDELVELGDNLHIVRVLNSFDECVSASFILSDQKFAHYHLSGSTGSVNGANNLLLWTLMQWAAEEGLEAVHLGGGLQDGDSLFKFKASLGGISTPFFVGTVILREDEYNELSRVRAEEAGVTLNELKDGEFFPAYRARG